MQPPTPMETEKDLKTEEFTLDIDSKESYHMKISYGEKYINFFAKNLKNFPFQFYELSTTLEEIQNKDENFVLFNSPKTLVSSIKKCITNNKYKISSKDEKLILSLENDFFTDNTASIIIPIKEQETDTKVNALNQVILDLMDQIKTTKTELNNLNEDYQKTKTELNALKKEKEDKILLKKNNKIKFAKESFEGTEILNDEEKVLISEWIDEKKVFKFNMLYSSKKDGDTAGEFHENCDGVSPTVVVIKDTNGNKFGGYTTSSWAPPYESGSCYSRDQNAFTFSLSKKRKVEQADKFSNKSIYKSYGSGPTFGSNYLYISNGCTGNQDSCTSSGHGYDPQTNLIGNSLETSFQVACYEVYHVIKK